MKGTQSTAPRHNRLSGAMQNRLSALAVVLPSFFTPSCPSELPTRRHSSNHSNVDDSCPNCCSHTAIAEPVFLFLWLVEDFIASGAAGYRDSVRRLRQVFQDTILQKPGTSSDTLLLSYESRGNKLLLVGRNRAKTERGDYLGVATLGAFGRDSSTDVNLVSLAYEFQRARRH